MKYPATAGKLLLLIAAMLNGKQFYFKNKKWWFWEVPVVPLNREAK